MLGAAFLSGCGGGGGSTDDFPVTDTDVPDTSGGGETSVEPDSSMDDTGGLMVDTGAPDTGAGEATVDSTLTDTGTMVTDSGAPDAVPSDSADTAPTCEVGASCDDGDKCNTGKTFNGSCVCSGGTPVTCTDSNECTTDTCEFATGCKFTTKADGASCGAGKLCVAGVCNDSCTPGASCNDGNACTTGETFSTTCTCTGGTATVCNDSNDCTNDTCNMTTGCVFTNKTDGTACGAAGSGKTCKAGVCSDPPVPPSITIVTPTAGAAILFNGKSDVCSGMTVTVQFTAPAGFKDMRWRFITPTSGSGDCRGLPVYGYFIDHRTYGGLTSGTMSENVSVAGLYSGPAGSGRWWWCTAPNTSTATPPTAPVLLSSSATSPVVNYGPPGTLGYQTLSNYCFYGNPITATTPTTAQWTLEVQLQDQAGTTVTATRKFWIYDP